MLKVLLLSLLVTSSVAVAKKAQKENFKLQTTYGYLHLISYDHLKSLSANERAKYITELRTFLVDQERKHTGKSYGRNTSEIIRDLISEYVISEAQANPSVLTLKRGQATPTVETPASQTEGAPLNPMTVRASDVRKLSEQKKAQRQKRGTVDVKMKRVTPEDDQPSASVPADTSASAVQTTRGIVPAAGMTAVPEGTFDSTATAEQMGPPEEVGPPAPVAQAPASTTAAQPITPAPSSELISEPPMEPATVQRSAATQTAQPAASQGGSCTFEKELTSGQKKLIEKHHDRCVVGGYMVCLSFNEKNRFGCWKNNEYKEISKANGCDPDKGDFSCAPPLYLNKNGGPLCVKSPGHTPVGKACDDHRDGMAPKDLQKYVDKPEFKEKYANLKSKLEDYCRHDGKNAFIFDVVDCVSLNNRTKAIANPQTELANGVICKKDLEIDGSKLSLTLNQTKETKLVLDPSKKIDGWMVAKCDGNLRPRSSTEDKSASNDYHESCFVKEHSETHLREVYAFQDNACTLHHGFIASAGITDIVGGRCKIDITSPRDNGFAVEVSSDKGEYWSDTDARKPLARAEDGKRLNYSAEIEKGTTLTVHYNKDASPVDKCWTSEVTVIPGQGTRAIAAQESDYGPGDRPERQQ